jgi:peroxiredoxin
MTALRVGDAAPDFRLPGTDGTPAGHRDYTLSEYAGQPVVLVFYPGDNTPVCTRQLNSYTEDIDAFQAVDAQVLAISPQSVESHDAFSDDQGGFAFPLLADVGKQVGRRYGILGPVGFYRRSVFVVDPGGVVRHAHRAVAGLGFRPTDELVAAVDAAR